MTFAGLQSYICFLIYVPDVFTEIKIWFIFKVDLVVIVMNKVFF